MKALDIIALTLLIIGGINWGLVGLFDIDMVATLAGVDTALANIIYIVIGVASVYSLYLYLPILRGEDSRRGHLDIDSPRMTHR